MKKIVEELLRKRDHVALLDLCDQDRKVWQEIRFRLYDLDERVRWSAIETVAKLMGRWWEAGKQEKVRIYIRTLFWSMNEESGGIGWSSPQAIAEIIVQIPEIIDPYGSMMIAHSIEEPPLMKGGCWGIGRLGTRIKDSVEFFREKILAVFQEEDAEILGLAAWAMGRTAYSPAKPFLEDLMKRKEPVEIYMDGVFCRKPVKQWSAEALESISISLRH